MQNSTFCRTEGKNRKNCLFFILCLPVKPVINYPCFRFFLCFSAKDQNEEPKRWLIQTILDGKLKRNKIGQLQKYTLPHFYMLS
jgi:hypothetical protein